MILFEKQYDAESLYDISRDIAEALDEDYNLALSTLPKDHHGFHLGRFSVKIEWTVE